MVETLKGANVALRGLMEIGILVALGYWGFRTGNSQGLKTLLGVGVPVITCLFWGFFDFRTVVKNPEPYRLVQELVISGLAALAWFAAGQRFLGLGLGLLSVVHHALVYMLGGTLLKH